MAEKIKMPNPIANRSFFKIECAFSFFIGILMLFER
jgi:hypothetical protein